MILTYLLKVIACSTAFYGLFALLFRNEKMLVFNRFYLLGALIASFIIPLITFTVYVPGDSHSYNITGVAISAKTYTWLDYLKIILAIVLASGSILFLKRFIVNLLRLKRKAQNHQHLDFKGAKIILLNEPVVPHSFFNTIFLNNDEYQRQHIEGEVLEHELAHIRQKHSWDILFIELIQIFCWFNPIIYLYKQSIKINHELLADAAVVKQLDNMRSYQQILLQRAGAQPSLALASSFHFFITKKRIIMLQKKANPVIAGTKAMLSLPLLAALTIVFSERVYAQVAPSPQESPKTVKASSGKLPGNISTVIVKGTNGGKSTAVIRYKNGKEVSGDVSTPEKQRAFEKEYGIELPPPPPAPPSHRKLPPPPPEPPKAAKAPSGKLPDNVETVVVKQVNGEKSTAVIRYKNGEEVSKDISTPEKLEAFEKEYGVEVPPPPPPAPKKHTPPPPVPSVTKVSTPPMPAKDKEVVSFMPPKIVKDKEIKAAPVTATKKQQEPMIAASNKVKRFVPPVIIKDNDVHKIVKEASPAVGADNPSKTKLDF